MSNINIIPNEPNLKDLLDFFGKDLKLNFNCHHVGTIEAFNALDQTAAVSINYTKEFLQISAIGSPTTTTASYPINMQCPVICLSGGLGFLTFPIEPGDECLVLFNDRDFSNWFGGSSSSAPNTGRLHSYTDAVVLVGLSSLPNVLLNYDTSRAVLGYGEALVGVGGGGGTKVKIANTIYTLNGLLQNLATQLENLTMQLQTLTTDIASITVICAAPASPSSIPVNAAAFTAVGTSIGVINTQITTIATEIGLLLE